MLFVREPLVQGHALERLIELDALRTSAAPGDPFNPERRLERRQPALAAELPSLVPGYDATPLAAIAMLNALRRRGAALDSTLGDAIEAMARA